MNTFEAMRTAVRRYGIRYLAVGVWNTLFGVGVYTLLLLRFGQEHYLLLGVFSNVLAITNTFLGHKFIVFRTRGSWLKEYLRCYVVYSGNMLFGFAGMMLCVEVFHWEAVWSNLVVTAVNFILTFFAQRFFSFGSGVSDRDTGTGREGEAHDRKP